MIGRFGRKEVSIWSVAPELEKAWHIPEQFGRSIVNMGVRGEVRDRERVRDHIMPCRPCKEFLFFL